MLEGYFSAEFGEVVSDEKRQRLLAVQAALEVVKASASAAGGDAGAQKLKYDLVNAATHFEDFVNAIQTSLEDEEE